MQAVMEEAVADLDAVDTEYLDQGSEEACTAFTMLADDEVAGMTGSTQEPQTSGKDVAAHDRVVYSPAADERESCRPDERLEHRQVYTSDVNKTVERPPEGDGRAVVIEEIKQAAVKLAECGAGQALAGEQPLLDADRLQS